MTFNLIKDHQFRRNLPCCITRSCKEIQGMKCERVKFPQHLIVCVGSEGTLDEFELHIFIIHIYISYGWWKHVEQIYRDGLSAARAVLWQELHWGGLPLPAVVRGIWNLTIIHALNGLLFSNGIVDSLSTTSQVIIETANKEHPAYRLLWKDAVLNHALPFL